LNQPEDKIRGIEAGADDFLTKPVNQPELMARVRTTLKLKKTIDRKMEKLLRIKDHLTKFVPLAVRHLVEENPEAPMLEKQEKDVSVLFADLSGYSRFSRMMDHDRVNAIVELYFSSFLDCIHEHGGDITATAGDGMMIVFQDHDILEHPKNAARAALKILGATDELNRDPHEISGPIAVHMGLNSGVAMVGSARFEGLRGTLWTFTANGPVTNLAARLGAAPSGRRRRAGSVATSSWSISVPRSSRTSSRWRCTG
jgi:class 3 adenylate cyclase